MLNATSEEELKRDYRALRMKTTPGHQELHSSLAIVRPDGGRTYVWKIRKPFEAIKWANPAQLLVADRGVFYLFAEHDSDHFFLFGSEPSSAADTAIDGIFLHSFCNGVSINTRSPGPRLFSEPIESNGIPKLFHHRRNIFP